MFGVQQDRRISVVYIKLYRLCVQFRGQRRLFTGRAQLYWMAEKYNQPLYSWYQRRVNGAGGVFDLMWYNPEYHVNPDTVDIPLDAVKRGEQNCRIQKLVD